MSNDTMTELEQELAKRFGEKSLTTVEVNEGEIPLILLKIDTKSPVSVLMTNGLSDFEMQVPEKMKGREYNELFFCIPSYWDLSDKQNINTNWIYPWIQRMVKYVREKNSWFGPGHTMPCGNPFQALSPIMKLNHFFLSDPILLAEELRPLQIGEKTVHFLAIIPIFEDEMDYKQGKGTFKLLKKFSTHGITEKLDDFRGTVLRSKWRFWK